MIAMNTTRFKLSYFIDDSPYLHTILCRSFKEAQERKIVLARNIHYHDFSLKRINLFNIEKTLDN